MAKNVTMKKGETIIKCTEDHIEHFQKNGFAVKDQKSVSKKADKEIKETKEKEL
tara:strand:+ start:2993 stop:3154 length:162 start_codon:yes stop_codon:yes gene_type:complete